MTTQEILKIIEEEFEEYGHMYCEDYGDGRDEFLSAVEKRLNTLNESDKWEVGRHVRITKCINGHDFPLGFVTKLLEFDKSDRFWTCKDDYNQHWYITEEEGELIK